ncbi:MAG: 16S rRNA (guanine(966)-N(2))-methyltransferase RsmD [Myxococcales bacterium]|nr:MAG: 16S rRNA (guanine(966)-N(2))-methyltransferase RsmD [Myxococcales bacterium]
MRVIAGALRGRALKAPPGDATRPTGARVKEALFSILGDMTDLAVLDLYAGSGALGIEALSRGARSAVLVESARPALTCLRENVAKLGLEGSAKVLPLRVEAALQQVARLGPFDLVLCDPPWKDIAAARATLEALATARAFSAGARIALEHSAKDPPPAPEASLLRVCDERRWGDTAVLLLEPADAPASHATDA